MILVSRLPLLVYQLEQTPIILAEMRRVISVNGTDRTLFQESAASAVSLLQAVLGVRGGFDGCPYTHLMSEGIGVAVHILFAAGAGVGCEALLGAGGSSRHGTEFMLMGRIFCDPDQASTVIDQHVAGPCGIVVGIIGHCCDACKGICGNGRGIAVEIDLGQCATAAEAACANGFQRAGQLRGLQSGEITQGIAAEMGDALSDLQIQDLVVPLGEGGARILRIIRTHTRARQFQSAVPLDKPQGGLFRVGIAGSDVALRNGRCILTVVVDAHGIPVLERNGSINGITEMVSKIFLASQKVEVAGAAGIPGGVHIVVKIPRS